jgi:Holliday junction resolvase
MKLDVAMPSNVTLGVRLNQKSTAETGREFENRVKKYLISKGYRVIRHLRHCDWEATKNGKKYFVECKLRENVHVSQEEMRFLMRQKDLGHQVIIATKDKTGHIILKGKNYKKPKRKVKRKSSNLSFDFKGLKI